MGCSCNHACVHGRNCDCCGLFFALLIRFDFRFSNIEWKYVEGYRELIGPYIILCIIVFWAFRLYHSIWRFASISELYRIIVATITIQVVGWAQQAIQGIRMPISYWIVGGMVTFAGSVALRFGYRFLRVVHSMFNQRHLEGDFERIMVNGAGNAGKMIIHELIMSSHIVAKVCCVIDDNPVKHGRYLDGIPIVGDRNTIIENVEKYGITKIIYAIPDASAQERKKILSICNQTDCEIQTVPGMYQFVNGRISVSALRHVELEDLLGRDQVIVDNVGIHGFISGKVVMVTGGGGSIGSELCRQIAKEDPELLIIFDIYENNAYEIQQELKRKLPNVKVETLIGSVRNTNRLEWGFDTYHPTIIFHAAAHKHVPLMEESPNEAIKNNVFGTYKLAKAASEHGVKKFILISTDKAVNPTNIMGASKRLCEMVIQMMNRKTDTEFAAVRFGNVLGSNGSVVPLFKKQIAEGGPVTVTDKRVIRYFMTIPEAVSLVIQAGIYAHDGEIFVLDMGEPVKIDDMARNLIKLSGYEPDVDIQIVYTGLRPGEKLYEEMLMNEEGLKETPNKLIHIGEPIDMDDEKFMEQLKMLEKACKSEREDIRDVVASIVKTYHPEEGEHDN